MNRKLLSLLMVTVLLAGISSSCKKDEDDPTPAEKNGVLLGGQRDKSKTWKMVKFIINGTDYYNNFPPCQKDNIYTFNNNAEQSFVVDEGPTKCHYEDDPGTTEDESAIILPQTVEKGRWAFTTDGKIVIIAANELVSPDVAILAYFSTPGTITTLNETQFEMQIVTTSDDDSDTATLGFEAIQ
jgi:hypothetical protein